jgi:hypothetical protein
MAGMKRVGNPRGAGVGHGTGDTVGVRVSVGGRDNTLSVQIFAKAVI